MCNFDLRPAPFSPMRTLEFSIGNLTVNGDRIGWLVAAVLIEPTKKRSTRAGLAGPKCCVFPSFGGIRSDRLSEVPTVRRAGPQTLLGAQSHSPNLPSVKSIPEGQYSLS